MVKNKESKVSRMKDNNNGLQENFTIGLNIQAKVISVRDEFIVEMRNQPGIAKTYAKSLD
jgi:hypothetical protein